MKLGISASHGEAIHSQRKKNFTLFFEFLKEVGIEYERIQYSLASLENLLQYSSILIGAPRESFSEAELEGLRKYVELGGNLLIILKFGGNRILGTNIGNLFEHISANDDMLILPQDEYKTHYNPPFNLQINSPHFCFRGEIWYPRGCTFEVKKPVELALYPDHVSRAGQNPRWHGGRYVYTGEKPPGAILIYDKIGKGSVTYWGSYNSFTDIIFEFYQHSLLYRKILVLLFPTLVKENLQQRIKRPQRHRLLHGYPMRSGLKKISFRELGELEWILQTMDLNPSKPLALGIIPHPFCNPTVQGCGFCTFPQEKFSRKNEKKSVNFVAQELKSLARNPFKIAGREISSIYLGGGTANLISRESLDKICEEVKGFGKSSPSTEITLEGVPFYFSKKKWLLSDFRKAFPESKLRISMGVQTFDQKILELMGRQSLNRERSVEKALEEAKKYDIHSSGDFLFNLPGQKFDGIQSDILRGMELGLDHICVYNLVCFEGLGSTWSKNPALLKELPSSQESLENWLKLYDLLTTLNYRAVTLTDFQREGSEEKGRYIYEEDLRKPEAVDWLGIGPYGISFFADKDFSRALKLMNPEGFLPYIKAQKEEALPWEKFFFYSLEDLKIYWITRQIKGNQMPKSEYSKLFGSTLDEDFGREIQACLSKNLLEETEEAYQMTPKGMYYSDSVAGLFAWLRVKELSVFDVTGKRTMERDWNISLRGWMG